MICLEDRECPICNRKAYQPQHKVQKKGKFPSQTHQNPKSIHEIEAQERNLQSFEVLRQVKVNILLLDMIKQKVSAIIQCKSPVKYKDPGCPTILESIGGTCVEKALLDLGATNIHHSISANRSLKIPRGMIEDVLVQVDKFYYPWILLFLIWIQFSTSSICTKTYSSGKGGLEEVCVIDTLVEEHCDQRMQEDLIESFGDLEEGLPKPSDLLATLLPWRRREEILLLFNEEETQRPDCLLEVLRRCKKAIGWQISDLKGISPLVCTHHIYMENEAKPVCQPQRMLNPHMQEVVQAEVLKLLQAGIICPISDSPWVSPTQVVPKKFGITVVQNDKGEDVSTHLTTGWRVCINYRRLNAVTRKDHFRCPLLIRFLRKSLGILSIVS
ncbi:hypothetical protein AAG906_037530 [Vitis piasezkii]